MKHQLINERNEPTHAQERVSDVEVLLTPEDIAEINKGTTFSFDINMKVGKVIIKKESD